MNTLLALLGVIAMAHAGLHGAVISGVSHGGALQGPGSHAAVIGPDGSHISVATVGGGVGVGGGHVGGVVGHGLGLGGLGLGGVGLGLGGYGGIVGSGLEGQYVPSGLEHLYDDGSYRLEHHLEGVHGLIH